MPLYDYQCTECHECFVESFNSNKQYTTCPTCGETAIKIPSPSFAIFKGRDFYANSKK